MDQQTPDKPTAPALDLQQAATPMAVPAPVSPQAVYMNMTASPTTVVQVNVPASPRAQHVGWTSGVCGCTDNCCNLWMVACCPCVTYGQIAARVGGNGCCDCGCCCSSVLFCAASAVGCNWLITCLLRQKVANATGVKQNCCDDTMMSCFCGPCVTCQMANHLDIQKDSCSFGAPPLLESMQR